MDIQYNKKRSDITFCTMLFKMPDHNKLGKIKRYDRKFEEFYLKSLQKLITTFERVALWCDHETAVFLKKHGLDKKVQMRVMKYSDLPHYHERENNLKILESMQKNNGFLLKHRKPSDWPDYFTIICAKPYVIKWAAENNKYKSDYFMWIDAGSFSPNYANNWNGWTGRIDAHPKRCRFCIAPTLGKSRPPFVPRFMYDLYKKFATPIGPATAETLARQDFTSIAMINADYDVPGGSFIIPGNWVNRFTERFEAVRTIMRKHGVVSVEQAVFQTMMKLDGENMFEVCYIHGYDKLYPSIAKAKPDHLL